MTEAEVHDFFAPGQKAIEDVRSWLESSGISGDRVSHSVNKQWLQFEASTEELEALLRTEYRLYSHAHTGRSHIACRESVDPFTRYDSGNKTKTKGGGSKASNQH